MQAASAAGTLSAKHDDIDVWVWGLLIDEVGSPGRGRNAYKSIRRRKTFSANDGLTVSV